MPSGYVGWLAVLNQLAGTVGLGEQAAANAWAHTKGLSTDAALNIKAGFSAKIFETNAICNILAGTSELEALDALNHLAGNGRP